MRFAACVRDGKRHVGMVEGARILPVASLWEEPRSLGQMSKSPDLDGIELALPIEAPGTNVCLGSSCADPAREAIERLRIRRLRSARGAAGQG